MLVVVRITNATVHKCCRTGEKILPQTYYCVRLSKHNVCTFTQTHSSLTHARREIGDRMLKWTSSTFELCFRLWCFAYNRIEAFPKSYEFSFNFICTATAAAATLDTRHTVSGNTAKRVCVLSMLRQVEVLFFAIVYCILLAFTCALLLPVATACHVKQNASSCMG